ncbi:hypothetical protein GCM10011492_25000 [Flexivirga endophytica]|uniref:Glycosyltransferase family 2 protein n=1 Tax=Flexivirga endophytica TaxID=1849103 RepID=A0A916T6D0_9MICO|nr:glycosyltransferase family A protein [Flexivirga endophytica]GGB33414.1 hypothetical protein GCM10011492_25000 [Flexivirga endophytica]GHB41396.1 hypothetical protein GCM10008112_07390 [Flexivirga endophytica]
MLKISVVVAVYNPGRDIDELLTSIDAQSMSAEEFEVIFVDDDSTDGTRERLQEWAGERANIQVLHNTPNSGWPGRPRNLGIDVARGEYLFFADNDDKLTPDALTSMYDYARENDSDVVIPKEIGVGPGRSVPRALFRRNIPDAKLVRDPILGILTPHKLVRTAMVREHRIRFPEGRVRLEDHFFMMSCYFAAQRISVFADAPCYYWMRRTGSGDNASFSVADPVMYYQSVERVLGVVEVHTEPGVFRDKLYSHWYQAKMLARLRGGFLLEQPEDYQESLLTELRRVSAKFGLDERLFPYLGAGSRARARLLLHGTMDEIRALASAERGVTQRVRLRDVRWTDDGKLSLSIDSEFVYADGYPITMQRDGDRVRWDVARRVPEVSLEPIDVSDIAGGVRLHTLLSDRRTMELQFCEADIRPTTGDRLGAHSDVLIDPAEAFRDKPSETVLDLRVRLNGLGWASEVRLPVGEVTTLSSGPFLGDRRVEVYATKGYRKLSMRLVAPQTGRSGSAKPTSLREGRTARLRWEAAHYARGALRRARRGAGRTRRAVRGRLRRG